MTIYQCPIGFTLTSTLLAPAAFVVKVPGTFSGYPPTNAQGCRYLQRIDIVADVPTVGDYVDTILLTDDDGVIPSGVRAAFPSYPTLISFSQDMSPTGATVGGLYLDGSGKASFVPIDPLFGDTQIIPSGLYLKANINPASLSLIRTFRVNVFWGFASTTTG